MNPKRRDSNCERRSPDVYSTSSAASSTKNTNSNRPQVPRPWRMDLQDCLREMNSVMRVLDNSQLDAQNRVDELCSILDGGPMGLSLSTQSLASSSSAISPEMEILLRNQQTLLKQIADSKSQLSVLEQQYQQQSAAGASARAPLKIAPASTREVNASIRVSQDANALVERLKAQVEQTAEEYRRLQDALEGARVTQREMTPYEMEEDVFERGDPEGDAPVSDDNKMTIQSNPRFVRRMIPNGAPMSAPYTSDATTFDFPETPEQSDIEEKVRTLAETKQQIDALRGMITKLEGRGNPTPSNVTPRPVPVYPPMNPVQQKRRQQLREINRSLHDIETLIHREVVGPKRNLSVTENPLRFGARPRFNSCNVQPWDNYPLLEVPFRGSQPRSLTEAATWGGSSTQENSDNGEVQSDCTDSEIERIAAFNPVVTGARPKVREEPTGAASQVASSCDGCAHLAAYTQMLTLSLVQANEVINGQQKEIERLRGLLRPAPPSESSQPTQRGVRPLNNQVTPGVRANNYVDNLKSFSTLNLLSQPVERRIPSSTQSGERNDLNRDEERQRRKPNKNSMNSMNQINFCRYSSNPELNRDEENAPLTQLCRERLEMQPALDAATAFLASKEGELCTPDILIQTCRCLLDQLTPAGVSHKHILRVLQPTLGQFLARPVNPSHIMENLTGVLQKELAVLPKGNFSPSERTFVSGAAVSGLSDRSTAGNDQPEDADGASVGDAEGGEDMAEADQGTDDKEGAVGGRAPVAEHASSRENSAQGSPDISSVIISSSTHERFAPEDDH